MTEPTVRAWSARYAAELVRRELERGDEIMALRLLTEAVASFDSIVTEHDAADFMRPPGSTGDVRFDTLLATIIRWKALERGFEAPDWTSASALSPEWMPGTQGEPLPGWRAHVRRNTPALFLEKGILALPKSWSIA